MNEIRFSVAKYAAWAPGLTTIDAWKIWSSNSSYCDLASETEPALRAISPILRRRTNFLGKMALEAAYQCLGKLHDIPAVFCSRHGEIARSVELLTSLSKNEPLSPTSFSLSVHNAIAGLFSITRSDQASNIVISSKRNAVENALIEACGLLNDGAEKVLIVIYNNILPLVFSRFADQAELPYAWSWLIEQPKQDWMTLSWSKETKLIEPQSHCLPAELEIFRFFLKKEKQLNFSTNGLNWCWRRHVE